MTEPLFLDLQYAPQSGVVLPAGVVVRSRIVANEKIFLEIAAESSWNAVGVWIKNLRGKPIGHTVLQNRITPEGSFSHGEIPPFSNRSSLL